MRKIVLLICIFSITNNWVFSQEFCEWRGPGRTGVYNETGLLKKWPENGPELIWSIENLYKGYSSVSVANNTIYLTGINDTVDVLIAIDLKGNIKWQTPFGRARIEAYPESRCTRARSRRSSCRGRWWPSSRMSELQRSLPRPGCRSCTPADRKCRRVGSLPRCS